MRITVGVSRGNPLPWGIAIVFTIVGAAMVVIGFTVVGPIDAPGATTGAIPVWIAAIILVPIWLLYVRHALRVNRQRRRVVVDARVPASLAEPPGDWDPALVAVVVGEGKVPAVAVAATTLRCATRGWIDLHEVGDRVVVSFDPTPADDGRVTATDLLVVQALAARRSPETGDLTGPPLIDDAPAWWDEYVQDARGRATASGLLEPRIPFVGLMLLCIITATIVAIAFFWYIVAFVGLILLANGLPHLVARVGGYRLSATGLVERARWLAFARGLHERGGLADVGPAGVTVWGPYLVYGVLVGAAPRAAAALTPEVGRTADLPRDVVTITI